MDVSRDFSASIFKTVQVVLPDDRGSKLFLIAAKYFLSTLCQHLNLNALSINSKNDDVEEGRKA